MQFRSAKHATDGGTSRRFLDRFHTPRTSSKRRRAPVLEMLEGRTLLSISASFNAGMSRSRAVGEPTISPSTMQVPVSSTSGGITPPTPHTQPASPLMMRLRRESRRRPWPRRRNRVPLGVLGSKPRDINHCGLYRRRQQHPDPRQPQQWRRHAVDIPGSHHVDRGQHGQLDDSGDAGDIGFAYLDPWRVLRGEYRWDGSRCCDLHERGHLDR